MDLVFLFGCVVAALCALFAAFQLMALRGLWFTPRLDALDAAPPTSWPRLSVIVAACNEADTLEPALRTLLAQRYPNLELVVVNDRSTDATGAILDRLAATDARLVAVHIETLPAGWLGKLHAFHHAAQRATGELLLFTDADVHFEPDVLTRVVAVAQARNLDHVTIFPQMTDLTVAAESAVAAFGMQLLATSNAPGVARPDSKSAVGVGAFNLVRKTVLQRSPGFEWIKMEVADDLGLAILMRDAGARRLAVLGCGQVRVQWYRDLPSMVRGLEKNMFGVVGQYSVPRMVALLCGLLAMVVSPYLALAHPLAAVRALGLGTCGLMLVMSLESHRLMHIRWVPALLMHLGVLVTAYAMARSMVVVMRDGGVRWRGTHYPLNVLKQGMRAQFGTRPGVTGLHR